MKIEQLEYIVEIDEFKSITKAAEHLFRTQPTVSHALQSLESELNLKIFERTRSGTEPTEAGKKIVEKSKDILNLINDIYEISKDENFNYSGTLSIASIPGMCANLLPKTMNRFKSVYPNINVKIIEGGSIFVNKTVTSNKSSIGLISVSDMSKVSEDFEFIPLFKSSIVLVSNSDSPFSSKESVSMKEIKDTPIVLYNEEYSIHDIVLSMIRKYSEPNIYLTSRNFHSLKEIVLQGLAVSFTSEAVVKDDPYVKNGNLFITDIKEETSNLFGIVYSKKTPLRFFEEAFIKELIEVAKEEF